MTFTANGEHLVSGGWEGVRVWRVKDGERVPMMKTGDVKCVAVSKDGRFIAAGSFWGNLFVLDGTTYEEVFAVKIPGRPTIYAVDFSPDSTRLVSANCEDCTATIWDIAARKKVQTFHHGSWVLAAKYSPQGDRIATAGPEFVQVWDSNDRKLLVDVKVGLEPWHDLLWFNSHLFVKIKDSTIRQIDASTGSTISEWSVPHDHDSCIALPQHGKFIACSTKDSITFWDTLTHTQLALIPRSSTSKLIAFSPDDRIAIVSREENIIIKTLSLVKVCLAFFQYLPAREHVLIHGKDLDIRIENAALEAWKSGELTDAETLLTAAIPRSTGTAHHVLASRALVRACMRQWDTALVDAEEVPSL